MWIIGYMYGLPLCLWIMYLLRWISWKRRFPQKIYPLRIEKIYRQNYIRLERDGNLRFKEID